MWLGFLSTKACTDLEFQVADESVIWGAQSIILQDSYKNQFHSFLLFLLSLIDGIFFSTGLATYKKHLDTYVLEINSDFRATDIPYTK